MCSHNCETHMGDLPWPSYFRFVTFKNLFFTLNCHFCQKLLSSFFSFTFKLKILQSFISSQLTTWFCHYSQKTCMPQRIMCKCYQVIHGWRASYVCKHSLWDYRSCAPPLNRRTTSHLLLLSLTAIIVIQLSLNIISNSNSWLQPLTCICAQS